VKDTNVLPLHGLPISACVGMHIELCGSGSALHAATICASLGKQLGHVIRLAQGTHAPDGSHCDPVGHMLLTHGVPVELELAVVVDELVAVVVTPVDETVTAGFPVLELEPVVEVRLPPPAPPSPLDGPLHATTAKRIGNPHQRMRAT